MDHAFDNYQIEDSNNPSHDLLTNANSDLDFKIGKSPDIINSTSPFNDDLNNFMQNNTLSTATADIPTDKNTDANNTEKSPFIDSTTSLNPFGEQNNREEKNNSTDNVTAANDGGYNFEKITNDNQNAFLDEEDHSDQVDLVLQQQNEKNQQAASSPFECDMGPETSVDISDDVVMASEHGDVDLISKYSSDCTGNNTEDTSPVMNPINSTEDGIGMDFLKNSISTNIGKEFDSHMNPFADSSINVQEQSPIAANTEILEELSSSIKEDNSPSIENLQQTATDPLISPQNEGPSQLLDDQSFEHLKLNDFSSEKGENDFEEQNIDVLREMGKYEEKDRCDDDKYEGDEKDFMKYDHQRKENDYFNMPGVEVEKQQKELNMMVDNKEYETDCPKGITDNNYNQEQLHQFDNFGERNMSDEGQFFYEQNRMEEIVDSSLENELVPNKESEKADNFKSDQEQLTSGVIPESCDESEDEWRYMQLKEGEAEKKFVEQQQQVEVKKTEAEADEREHSQNNQENKKEEHQEITAESEKQTNSIALSSAQVAVDNGQEKNDLDIEKPTSNPIEEYSLKETSFSSSISNDPPPLEEVEEKKILNFGIDEEEDENNMMSQLNPDAKEFIPTSPSPVHFPLSPLANQIPPSFGSRGQIVDDIVSQSPRKPTVSMDEIQIPDETQFNTEISQCPSELLNFKESMHGSEKEISSPDFINSFSDYTEQNSKECLIPQQSTDFASAEMGQSIYIENNYTGFEELQMPQHYQEEQEPPRSTLLNDVTEILNSVQALPENEDVIVADVNEEISNDTSNIINSDKAAEKLLGEENVSRPIEMDIEIENKLPGNLPTDVINGVQPKLQSPQQANAVEVITELIQDLVVNDEKGPAMTSVNITDKNDLKSDLINDERKTEEDKLPQPIIEEKEILEKEVLKVEKEKENTALPTVLVEPEKEEVIKKEDNKTVLNKTPKTAKSADSLKKTPSLTKKTLASSSNTKSPREPTATKTSVGITQKSKPPTTATTTTTRPRTVPTSNKTATEKKTTTASANVRSKIDAKPPSNLVKKPTTAGSTSSSSKAEDQKSTKLATSRTGLTTRTPATTTLKSNTTAKPKPASATSTGNSSTTTKTVSQRLTSATGKPSSLNASSTTKTLSSPRSNPTSTIRKTEIKVSSSSLKTTTTKTTTTSSTMATKATKSQPVVSTKSSTSTTPAAKKTTPLASPRAPITKKTTPIKKSPLLKSSDKAIKDKISAGDAKSNEVVASPAASTNEKIQIESEVKLNGVTTAPEGTSNI